MNIEILAPAGSPESLRAAVLCGADAVYLGGAGLLNARRGAVGFDARELSEAVSFCHGRGARVYLTLNTLVREEEKDLLIGAAKQAAAIGVDAVLVQDMAVAATLRAACPDLDLHASTQTSITSVAGVRMAEELGFSRVVLGRELSLEEIKAIRRETTMELEMFVHGALCMSVSGQCYLSSIIGARSGNRGLCAQPCRLPFAFGESTHALSLRDLSLLDRLPDMVEAGICCVKIEGRMKRPEYVAAAVSACVAAREGRPYDVDKLADIFSRSGFTQGYFEGRRDRQMFGIRQKEDVTAATNKLLREYGALFHKETPRVPLDFELNMTIGQPARLTLRDDDGFETALIGETDVQTALTAPTTPERAAAALEKTGGTPFGARSVTCHIQPEAMLPASALNDIRRRALEAHLAQRSELRPHAFNEAAARAVWQVPDAAPTTAPALRVRIGRADQINAALDSPADMIILPLHLYDQVAPRLPGEALSRIATELPHCLFGKDNLATRLKTLRETGINRAVASSLGGIYEARAAGMEIHGDAFLNIFNGPAVETYRQMGLASCTLSFELMLREARAVGGGIPRGILAYGYLPVMALRACPAKAHGGRCTGTDCGYPTLTDRMDKGFFLDCDGHTSTLHNCLPLWMADRLHEIGGLDFYTLYLTRETPDEAAQVITAFAERRAASGEYTRGLYYRPENAAAKARPDTAGAR